MNIEEILSRLLTDNEIEWRVQSKKKGKTTVVPYITNRAVIKRFNEAAGVFGWKSEVVQIQPIKTIEYQDSKYVKNKLTKVDATVHDSGFIATISVYNQDTKEWVSKSDISDNTDIEPLKGGVSGAYKRAAVHWGMGLELYDYPIVQVEGEHIYIPRWANDRLKDIINGRRDGTFSLPYVLISEGGNKQQSAKPQQVVNKLSKGDFKAWGGGRIYTRHGKSSIYVNSIEFILSDEQVTKIKADPRYKAE